MAITTLYLAIGGCGVLCAVLMLLNHFWKPEPLTAPLVKAQPIARREFRSEPTSYTKELNQPKDETINRDQMRIVRRAALVEMQKYTDAMTKDKANGQSLPFPVRRAER